jgi:predicted Zn finger-like uncharacterized protein
MQFTCEACRTPYTIADSKLGQLGIKVQCKKCAAVIVVRPSGEVSLLPAAAPAPESASLQDPERDQEPEPVASAPAAMPTQASLDPVTEEIPPWYVAVDGVQDGPLIQDALFDRLRAGSVGKDALVWRQGMADWQVLGSCPEFEAFFMAGVEASAPEAAPAARPTERRQVQAAARPTEAPVPAAARGAGAASEPQAIVAPSSAAALDPMPSAADRPAAGPAPLADVFPLAAPASEQAPWQPTAASELSALAQRELRLLLTAEHALPVAASGPGDVLKNELGLGLGPRPATDPTGRVDGSTQWQLPATPRASGRLGVGLKVGLGVLVCIGLAAGGNAGLRRWRLSRRAADAAAAVAPPSPATSSAASAGAAPAAATSPSPAAGAPPVAATGTASPVAKAPPTAPAAPAAPKPTAPQPPAAVPPSPAAAVPPPAKLPPKAAVPAPQAIPAHPPGHKPPPAKRPLRPPAPKPKAKPVRAVLRRDDIVGALSAHEAKLTACLRAARSRGELSGGINSLLLDWVITPGGEVADPQLHSPDGPVGDALTHCIVEAIGACRFPPSQAGAPVHNYPLMGAGAK